MAWVVARLGTVPRWQWWFDSPNDLGPLAAGMSACCLVAVVAALRGGPGRAWLRWLIAAAAAAGALVCLAGAVGSASRAGMLVLACSAVLLILALPRGSRRYGVAWLAACCVAYMCEPAAAARAATMDPTQAGSDGSITHRLEIWRGVLAMLTDLPQGVPIGYDFQDVYARWYESTPRGAIVWHPLNDTLLVAAACGWSWAAAYAAIVGGTCIGTAVAATAQRSLLATAAACAVVAVGVGGATSALLRTNGPGWWVAGALLAAVVVLVVRHRTRAVALGAGSGMAIGIIAVLIAYLLGRSLAQDLPLRADPALPRCAAGPRAGDGGQPIDVLIEDRTDLDDYARALARPLAIRGYRVRLCTAEEEPRAGAALIVARGFRSLPAAWRTATSTAVILIDPLPGLAADLQPPHGLLLSARPDTQSPWQVVAPRTARVWARHVPENLPLMLTWLQTHLAP